MRVVIQRVAHAEVRVDGAITGKIGKGLLVLTGFEDSDTDEDLNWIASKLCNLRIFNDDAGLMNLSVTDVGGDVLLVSQFTLHALTKKGNRPSFIKAAKPDKAIPLYEKFKEQTETMMNKKVATGIFGADMKVSLLNDGPVTIIIDSKNRDF
jgi:D-aminoacyl-tRNA deacylase